MDCLNGVVNLGQPRLYAIDAPAQDQLTQAASAGNSLGTVPRTDETNPLWEYIDSPLEAGVIEVVMKLPYCGVRRETRLWVRRDI